jgi:hypothetical protein
MSSMTMDAELFRAITLIESATQSGHIGRRGYEDLDCAIKIIKGRGRTITKMDEVIQKLQKESKDD